MEISITLIYPFRNRDSIRVKNSLDSLRFQKDKSFKVLFVDFGSETSIADEVKEVVNQYSFAEYIYTYHIHQPWNKCKAINIGLDKVKTSHCFVSDVDMIYDPEFISIAKEQAKISDVTYFQVGYLPHDTKIDLYNYQNIIPYRISNENATGLTLFNAKQLIDINGFDEYFHFWSSEDTDAHMRMKNKGFNLKFYDEKLLIKHQPHPTYRSRETKKLTVELRLTNAVRLNQKRMLVNKDSGISVINQKRTQVISKNEYLDLYNPDIVLELSNTKSDIYYYLLEEIKRYKGSKVLCRISRDVYYKSLKYYIKELLNKNSQPYMSMKEVNDLLLQQVIFNFRQYNYSIIISDDLNVIEFSVDLRQK